MTTSCSHIGLWSGYAEQHEPLIWDGYFYVLLPQTQKLYHWSERGTGGVQVEHREKWKWLKERKTDEKQRQTVKWGRREKLRQQRGFSLTRERLYRIWPVHLVFQNMETENKLRMVMKRPLSRDCCLYINIRMVLLLPDSGCHFLFLSWEKISSTFCCFIIG